MSRGGAPCPCPRVLLLCYFLLFTFLFLFGGGVTWSQMSRLGPCHVLVLAMGGGPASPGRRFEKKKRRRGMMGLGRDQPPL